MAGADAEFRKQAHYVTENLVQIRNKNNKYTMLHSFSTVNHLLKERQLRPRCCQIRILHEMYATGNNNMENLDTNSRQKKTPRVHKR
jgi:hypothetical protein